MTNQAETQVQSSESAAVVTQVVAVNIFEQASRNKLRFDTNKGTISVEDLWDLPLTSETNRANLDDIARNLFNDLRDAEEVSFVRHSSKKTATQNSLKLKFEIVKHIIDTRLAEIEAAKNAADRANRKRQLTELLHSKQQADLQSKSTEEIQKMIDAL
jgi:hypothetical protein